MAKGTGATEPLLWQAAMPACGIDDGAVDTPCAREMQAGRLDDFRVRESSNRPAAASIGPQALRRSVQTKRER
jgi:hypothetical protein